MFKKLQIFLKNEEPGTREKPPEISRAHLDPHLHSVLKTMSAFLSACDRLCWSRGPAPSGPCCPAGTPSGCTALSSAASSPLMSASPAKWESSSIETAAEGEVGGGEEGASSGAASEVFTWTIKEVGDLANADCGRKGIPYRMREMLKQDGQEGVDSRRTRKGAQ